jgi:hypothetical protein
MLALENGLWRTAYTCKRYCLHANASIHFIGQSTREMKDMPTITRRKPPVRNSGIHWDEFTDGQTRVCKAGEDFEGEPWKCQHRARHAAERRGMKAQTWTEGGDVYIRFYKVKAS